MTEKWDRGLREVRNKYLPLARSERTRGNADEKQMQREGT